MDFLQLSLYEESHNTPKLGGKKEEQGQEQEMVPLWKEGISADPATDLRVISRPPPLHTLHNVNGCCV